MKRISDVMLIENVPEYEKHIIASELGNTWDLDMSAVIDPRIFGIPAARPRLYVLAFNKDKVQPRPDVCLWLV